MLLFFNLKTALFNNLPDVTNLPKSAHEGDVKHKIEQDHWKPRMTTC